MKRNLKKILINILLFGAFFVGLNLFFSCSPQKRLSRLVKANPELLQRVKISTPYILPIPERVVLDTNFKVRNNDTTWFSTNNAYGWVAQQDSNIRLQVITKKDTIRDTVYTYIDVPQVKVIATEKEKDYG